jgi:hypothetical protein
MPGLAAVARTLSYLSWQAPSPPPPSCCRRCDCKAPHCLLWWSHNCKACLAGHVFM